MVGLQSDGENPEPIDVGDEHSPPWLAPGASPPGSLGGVGCGTAVPAEHLLAFGETWPYYKHLFDSPTQGTLHRDYDAERLADPEAYAASALEEAKSHEELLGIEGGSAVYRDTATGKVSRREMFSSDAAEVWQILQDPALHAAVDAMGDAVERSLHRTMVAYLAHRCEYVLGGKGGGVGKSLSESLQAASECSDRFSEAVRHLEEGKYSAAISGLNSVRANLPKWFAAHSALKWHGVFTIEPEIPYPLLDARIASLLAKAYASWGLPEKALDLSGEALSVYRDIIPQHPACAGLGVRGAPFIAKRDYLVALHAFGKAALEMCQFRDAIAVGQEGLELEEDELQSQETVILGLDGEGRFAEAAEQRERLLELQRMDEASQITAEVYCRETRALKQVRYHKSLPRYMLSPSGDHPLLGFETIDACLLPYLKLLARRGGGGGGGSDVSTRFPGRSFITEDELIRRDTAEKAVKDAASAAGAREA
eukprot:TRINITY_DN74077_c0_g1_i1.p1 TRINITY_DN74077_c0_g1~~TRINITY_DN74077_c0_g1_i1.p1  ORF type:complete len:541 (+),score=132.62 TRINITY_DN74077_c0_g1_i1:180-1625(+)